ncbi:MAG TPA: class F sortase, partial [Jiangellaceae bacterium]|nr:class F sortase [Jiangellaceae bacterium]
PVLRQRPGPRWLPGAASCMTPDPTHHPAHRRVTRGPARFAAGLALVAVLATIAIAATRGPDHPDDPAADPGADAASAQQSPPARLTATPTPTPPVEQSEVPLDPADSQAEAITGPYTLRIPRIGVDAPVVPIQSNQDRVLLPPRDPGIAGWWSDGAAPGAAYGSAVLVGHTVRNNGGGIFDDVGTLRSGDTIEVEGSNSALTYRVQSVDVLSKDQVARDAEHIFNQAGPGRLVVITCDDWDGTTWQSNIITIAAPV